MTTSAINFSGFLAVHAAFRQEFGLLANVANTPRQRDEADLFEDQLAMVLDLLHHHHTWEDDSLWPMLRARAPGAVPELDELEAEHDRLDPLIDAVGDAFVSPAIRADALASLHKVMNEHLDHEERIVLPLVPKHISADEWAAEEQRVQEQLAESDPQLQAVRLGWVVSATDDELRTALLAVLPKEVSALVQQDWLPAYERRARQLYGPFAPASVAG